MIPRVNTDRGWRWLALVALVANVAFNYISEKAVIGRGIAEVSDKYASLFTPADYAFSIWGVIYAALLIYAVYQLLPRQRENEVYDKLARPFVVSNILAMLWIVAFRMEYLAVSVVVIIALLITTLRLYIIARDAVLRLYQSHWLSVPFSLFAGWLSVATIACISAWLVSMSWQGSASIQVFLATGMIIAAGLLSLYVAFRCGDIVFPMPVAWAIVAIFIARQGDSKASAIIALAMGILQIIWITTTGLRQMSQRQMYRTWSRFSY